MSHVRSCSLLATLAASAVMTALPTPARAALPGAGLLSPVVGVPGNIVAADLNADGRPDFVAVEFGTDFLAVRINAGQGSFGPIRRYPVGLKPNFVTRGDLNGDGNVDIAVSNGASANVSVLLGNGDGTLQPARNHPISGGLLAIGAGSFALEAIDVGADGDQDIVTSNVVTNNISVLPGRGDGTFSQARVSPIPGPVTLGLIPFGLAMADFDGDGDPDIATGGATSVSIMRNDGSGRFTTASSNQVGVVAPCVKTGDVNSDGVVDVVATTWGGRVQVLLGNGNASFSYGDNLPSGGLVAQCFSLDDLNADGHLDLAVSNTSSLTVVGQVSVLIGHGDGHFGNDAVSATYPVNLAPFATAAADYDGDGIVDVAVVNSLPPTVALLRGNGDGTFRPQISYAM